MSGRSDDISPWEWVSGAIGLGLVVAAVWVLLISAFRENDRPPAVTVRVSEVNRMPNGWVVQFEARNSGDLTAADLLLRGDIVAGGGTAVESAEATIDFLPGGSVRRGGLFFYRDPAGGRLLVRPIGYREP